MRPRRMRLGYTPAIIKAELLAIYASMRPRRMRLGYAPMPPN